MPLPITWQKATIFHDSILIAPGIYWNNTATIIKPLINSMNHFFQKSKRLLITIEKFTAAISLLLLLIFTVSQIIARNFFETGFPQLDIISRHLVLYILFMGAALACEGNSHIKIDVLCAYLPQDRKNKLLKPLFLLSAVITSLFAWYSVVFWLDEWSYAADNQLLSVMMMLILPIGFSILSLHFLLLVMLGLCPQSETPAS
ncbi:MAG: TRAP transporter small permease [Gammaproteobacteria bacterium]|nr:MAG: TRAP transporter small permease [Gammaproteobacteria bacterium]